MQNQFNFQRFGSGQNIVDNGDQGTWQPPPMQMQKQAQEDTYFTGVCSQANATYYTSQEVGAGNVSGSDPSSVATNFKNMGGKATSSGQSQYTQGSMQDRQGGNGMNVFDDSDREYYGVPNESYMTSGGGNMMGMNTGGNSHGNFIGGMNSGGNMSLGGDGNMMDNMNSERGRNVMGMQSGGRGNMGMNVGGGRSMIGMNSGSGGGHMIGNLTDNGASGGRSMNRGNPVGVRNNRSNSMGMSGDGNPRVGGNFMSDNSVPMNSNNMPMDSGAIANQFQSELMAAVGRRGGHGPNHGGFNSTGGNFVDRGRRGRGVNRFKGPDFFYQTQSQGFTPGMGRHQFGQQRGVGRQNVHGGGEDNLTITLSASNYNTWCFLRKNFNKRDNDLAEHLFDIHEKFCHHCKNRIEEKKYGKRKKSAVEPRQAQAVSDEEPEEELTEEELEIKKLMGFAGFKSTKGSRVKENSYKTVSSVKISRSEEAEDQTTTLTEEEKRMIASIGGFSVFSKGNTPSSSKPGFGAPAVTFQHVEDSGPGNSTESLHDEKTDANKSEDGVEEKKSVGENQKQQEVNQETWR